MKLSQPKSSMLSHIILRADKLWTNDEICFITAQVGLSQQCAQDVYRLCMSSVQPISGQGVMCDVNSVACLQHGHELSTLFSKQASSLFVPQKCEMFW